MLDTGRCPSRPEGCAPAHCRPSRLTTGVGGTPDAGAHGTQPGRKRGAKDSPKGRPRSVYCSPRLFAPTLTLPLLDPRAAAPHNDGMNIRLFLGGHGLPKPSHPVGGWGNLVSPLPASPRWGEAPDSLPQRGRAREGAVSVGGLRPPKPSHRVGEWGNLVSPYPFSRVAPSPSRGRGRGETPGCPRPASPRWGEEPHSRPGGGGLEIGWSP
jgi:hypothetical protein